MSEYPVITNKPEFLLEGKIIIIGFPGMALVGKMTAEYLIEKMRLKRIASIYPVEAPSVVSVSDGIMEPPSITIYSTPSSKIGVLTGGFQPKSDESQQRLAREILEYLSSMKVKGIIAAAAFVVSQASDKRKVYATATNKSLLEKLVSLGCVPMEGGISGLNGLIPALAKNYRMEGAVLLGETGELYVAGGMTDFRSVASVVEVISKIIGEQIDTKKLYEKAEQIEETIKKAFTAVTTEKPLKEEEPSTHM